MDDATRIALTEMACGIYQVVEEYCKGSYSNTKKGKACQYCGYNTVKKKLTHSSLCPTTCARRALAAAKIEMVLWKVSYVFLHGELTDVDGVNSMAYIAYVPYPEKPSNEIAETLLNARAQKRGTMINPRVFSVEFEENLGYIADESA